MKHYSDPFTALRMNPNPVVMTMRLFENVSPTHSSLLSQLKKCSPLDRGAVPPKSSLSARSSIFLPPKIGFIGLISATERAVGGGYFAGKKLLGHLVNLPLGQKKVIIFQRELQCY